jgi:chromosome segregation ATPase
LLFAPLYQPSTSVTSDDEEETTNLPSHTIDNEQFLRQSERELFRIDQERREMEEQIQQLRQRIGQLDEREARISSQYSSRLPVDQAHVFNNSTNRQQYLRDVIAERSARTQRQTYNHFNQNTTHM